MPHAMLPVTEDILSDILNWVCPDCGGPMGGGPTNAFQCEGECRTDWRDLWERRLAKLERKQTRRGLWASGTRIMRTEKAREVPL
jgi:hypothetical protein